MTHTKTTGLCLFTLIVATGCGGVSPDRSDGSDGGPLPNAAVRTTSALTGLDRFRQFHFQKPALVREDVPFLKLPGLKAPSFPIASATAPTFEVEDVAAEPVVHNSEAIRIDVGAGRFVPVFTGVPRGSLRHPAQVSLPARSVGRFGVTDVASKIGIEVGMPDLHDVAGEVVDGFVIYRGARPDGDVLHRATFEGTEDFMYVEDENTTSLAYDVTVGSVAGLRLVSNTLEFLDASGTPRLRMAPPYVVDSAGVRVDAEVSVRGCAYDTDPSGPWGRPVTSPAGSICRVLVRWAPGAMRYPVLVDPAWTTTGSMTSSRTGHTATLLPSGRVLVAGGSTAAVAELYDETTGVFSVAGSMLQARWRHTATLLPSGKVLVAGGSSLGGTVPFSTAEMFDGAGSFTATGSMVVARMGHTATLLGDGSVFIVGGRNGSGSSPYLSSVERFGASSTFSYWGDMTAAHVDHTATLLPSGKVLVVGSPQSVGPVFLPTAEVLDLSTGLSTTPGISSRSGHTATRLASGGVLLVGDGGGLLKAERYDETGGVSVSGGLAVGRYRHTATLLNSNRVLIAGGLGSSGGGDLASVEVYDGTGAFVAATQMTASRSRHTATMLPSGRVLITGGGVSSAELFAEGSLGATCGFGGDCASGFCVDGVCCNNACPGACFACSLAGSLGTCAPVASGPPSPGRSCAPYATCTSGSCASVCATDADCTSSNYCLASKCVAKKGAGVACTTVGECLSGNCVDGVCCDSACTGQCSACNLPLKVGTCSAVTGPVVGSRTPCDGAGTTCGATCNGSDLAACHYPPTTTACSSNSCTSGKETHASTCDGAGKCNDVPKSCGAYVCDTNACKSSCTGNADCTTGFTCTSNVCVPVAASKLGDPCSDASTCPSGAFCTDGVCCSSLGCDAGSSCAANKKGTCSKLNGTSCTSGLECGSGVCVDGVCCDRACDGQCEACDVAGSFGTCKAILGAPHGTTRPKCDTGTTPCSAKSCDGKDPSKCATFVGSDVTCQGTLCSNATFTAASSCDGAGTCKTPSGQACAPYGCTNTGCRTDCSVATDCAEGFTCTASKCVPSGSASVCNEDRTASIEKATNNVTPCVAYRCAGDGKCGTSCGVTDDCMPGFACDLTSKSCAQMPAASTDSGGCSMGIPSAAASWGAWSVLAGVGIVALRRRRRTG